MGTCKAHPNDNMAPGDSDKKQGISSGLQVASVQDRPLLVVGMIGMIHPNGDEFHPKAPCHWDEIHPNGWRLLAPLG